MSGLPSLPLFVDAWVAATLHLSRAERGLYMDLLTLMWRTPGCRVPNDLDWIARRLVCSEEERPALQSIISEFCQSTGNWITQKRLQKEYEFVTGRVEKRREAAKSRWAKEKEQCKSNAPTPTPTPTPTEEGDGIGLARARDPDPQPLADLETKLREAAGWQSEPAPNLCVTGPIAALIAAGADLDLDVLPTVKALAARAGSRTSWAYFVRAIAQARDRRLEAGTIVIPPQQQTGSPHGKPRPFSRHDFFAEVHRRLDAITEPGADQGSDDDATGNPQGAARH
jgi:uncharacterized protein YdaU (DUF1376 family)